MTYSQDVIDALLKQCNPNRLSVDLHWKMQQLDTIRQQVAAIHKEQLSFQTMITNSLKELTNKLAVVQQQCSHPGLKLVPSGIYEVGPQATCEICGKEFSGTELK